MAVVQMSPPPSAVAQVVQSAANATGVDFNFLLKVGLRESGLRPGAHAPSSSAAGLFQFIEQTWLSTLKRHGAARGYGQYAAMIAQGSDGRYSVPAGEEARRAVMNLRYEPNAASVMAGELIGDNAAYLRGRVGREPTAGELYAAHFLGPQGSARLIEAASSQPGSAAASLFPDAAGSNRSVFYRDGRPLTVAELYTRLGGMLDSRAAMTSGGATGVVAADPGESAFIQYAGAGRLERLRLQELVVDFLLSDGKSDFAFDEASASKAPVQSMFSAEMLALLSQSKAGSGQTGAGR